MVLLNSLVLLQQLHELEQKIHQLEETAKLRGIEIESEKLLKVLILKSQ